jgi:serine/threonine protein kinase
VRTHTQDFASPTVPDSEREPGCKPAPDPLIGSTIGAFVVTHVIGHGGSACVYRARHPVTGALVAVKVLLPEFAATDRGNALFVQEASLASVIQSPALPKYYDFGSLPDGRAFAIMEFLNGETLEQALERGRLDLLHVRRIGIEVAGALRTAHLAGVLHRDLKPANFFLARDERGEESVKVLDFGIAKRLDHVSASRTQSGMFVGTPAYAAPEQFGGRALTPACDVYALGATLFEMLTGEPPFDGEVEPTLLAKVSSDAPALAELRPDLPDVVAVTVQRMLERRPEDRVSTMTEVIELLEAWPTSIVARPPPLPVAFSPRTPMFGPGRREVIRRRAALALAICAALPLGWWTFARDAGQLSTEPNTDVPSAPPRPRADYAIMHTSARVMEPIAGLADVAPMQLTAVSGDGAPPRRASRKRASKPQRAAPVAAAGAPDSAIPEATTPVLLADPFR